VSEFAVWITHYLESIRTRYGVNPVLFFALLVGCAPFFYYSIYRLVRAVASRDKSRITLWSLVFLTATALPWVYVLIFGRDLPWYIYLVLAALIGQGLYSLVRKIRK